jgi:hypothetical protein
LGNTQAGSCFIEGNILVIGQAEEERPGFLKREFMEHLNRLPAWDGTRYYCSIRALYRCRTREGPSSAPEFRHKADLSLISSAAGGAIKTPAQGVEESGRVESGRAVGLIKERIGDAWGHLKARAVEFLGRYLNR